MQTPHPDPWSTWPEVLLFSLGFPHAFLLNKAHLDSQVLSVTREHP